MTARRQRKTVEPGATAVYCGPTLPGVAKQFTVYRDGLPAALEAAKRETPALGGLIVPLEELPEAMRQLRTGRGPMFTLYKAVQENTHRR